MSAALQVGKAIDILSKYEEISIAADHDEIYLGVGYENTVSLEDETALKELGFRENSHNYWRKYI
jgi:hypothetical protein